MKKTILALSFLCSLGFAAQGQTPWILQNTTAPRTSPAYRSMQMHAVSEQVAWQLLQLDASNTPATHISKTANGGASWDFLPIVGATGYQAASIHALDGNTAFVAQFGASNGGEVLKTVNGGRNWVRTTTASQFVAANGGFVNWVYFFDANNGVAFGDPTGGSYEVLTTANGGTTWTRVPAANLPTPNSQEGGLVGSFAVVGNTVWAGTGRGTGLPIRILKSTDRGLTWTTSANTPLTTGVSKIAMTDANKGIAFRGGDMISTTDGGQTWRTQEYTGNFCHDDAVNVPGTNIIVSLGSSVTTPSSLNDVGSSYSTDNGATWIDIDRGTYYYTADFIGSAIGYAGGVTQFDGTGGVYKASATILGVRSRNTDLQKALSVYPNPSASGVFQVQLKSGIKAGTTVSVFDGLGRQVLSQSLNATAVASQETIVDLSKEKAGLYTLELRTATGVAQQKLVIE